MKDEPLVLPARIPHLLVNGASGIAVGIATRIPPHNMREVVAGLRALIHNPDISAGELMEFVPAPDFPTGGEVVLGPESLDMYATGRGSVLLRAKVTVEDDNLPPAAGAAAGRRKRAAAPVAAASRALEKVKLVITEVPYQTSKADLVLRIAELVEDKTIEGVSDVRDESDREGMRVVIEVRVGGSGGGGHLVFLGALDLRSLLADKPRVLQLVLSEAEAVAAKHGTPRRTRLFGSSSPAATAPPAAAAAAGGPGEGEGGSEHWSSGGAGQVEREVLLVYNQRGYVKRQDVADFSVVKRGKKVALSEISIGKRAQSGRLCFPLRSGDQVTHIQVGGALERFVHGREETTDVEKIYSAQSLFSIYLHSLPGNRQTRHTIFSSREVTGRVKTSYSDHSLIRLAATHQTRKPPSQSFPLSV
ncbi:MAG: hypothetical protein WDW36_010109 [Sanguina aurantia]